MIEPQMKALAALADERGVIEVTAVVDAARDPESPLHSAFEWDDSIAAEAHRRTQARGLIKRYQMTVVTQSVTFSAPMYVEAPKPAGSTAAYVQIDKVQSEDRREVALRELRRARSHLESAVAVATLFGAHGGLHRVLAMLDGEIARLGGPVLAAAAE